MALISPNEYLKGKGKEEKKVSGGLISPSDYLSQTKPVTKPPMETFRPLGEDFFKGKITQPPPTPTPTPTRSAGGYLGLGDIPRPASDVGPRRGALESATGVLENINQFLSPIQAGLLDTATFGITGALDKTMDRILPGSPGITPEQKESIPYKVGEFAGYLYPGALIERGVSSLAKPLISKLPGAAERAIKPIAARLSPQAGALTRIGAQTVGKGAGMAGRGATVGALEMLGQEAGDVAFRGGTFDPKNIALGAAAGGVLDPALTVGIPAAIKGVQKKLGDRALNKEIKKFIERTETGMPFEGDIAAMTRKTADGVQEMPTIPSKELQTKPYQMTRQEFEALPASGDYIGASPSPIKAQMERLSGEHDKYLLTNPNVKDDGYGIGTPYEVKEPTGDFVTVYRAVPEGVDIIRPGDYVTTSKKYAVDYLEGDWKIDRDHTPPVEVLSAKLPKEDLSVLGANELTWVPKDSYKALMKLAEEKGIATKPATPKNGVQALPQTIDGRPILPRGDKSTVGDIVKRSDIVENLSKKLDIPLRVGKYGQKAHGIFKVKPEVIRTRLANDVPVIAHEVGHTLDKRFKLSSAAFDNELLEIGKVTSGPGYSKNEIRREGVAEFFRLMLTDPSEAIARAPKFYQQFASKVPSEVQQVLLNAQEQIQRYINQPVLAKSISELQIGGKDKFKLPTLDDLYTKFVEELHPIKKALEPLGEAGKKAFEGFRLLRGSAGRARTFLKQGIFDENFNKIGKSFDEVITPVRENLDEFRAYIKDKRALELDERGIVTGSDLSRTERNFNINELESRYPQFKQAHGELKQYQDSLLNELVKSGVLDPADMATFKELNKEYVPFFRNMKVEKSAKKGTQMQGSPIKRIKGSDREIIDPLESIIKNTYQYTAIARHNKARLDLVDAITSVEGMGKFVEKVPTPMQGTKFSLDELRGVLEKAGAKVGDMDMDAVASIFRPKTHLGDNVISVLRNGKREFYELDPDLYLASTAANQEQMNTITRAFSFPTRMLRAGVVNTLEFWFKNAFRDQFEAAIKSDVGYIPFVDMIKGMYHVLGRTDLYTKFLSSGGAQSFRQSLDRNYLQHDLRNMLAKSMKDKSMNIIKNPLEAMRALSELSEISTRVGVFRKGVMKDESVEGIAQAAMTARDVIDFSRKGSVGKLINQAIPFWNAHIQGLDKTIRVFSNPKTAPKALAKSFAYITAPTVGLYQTFKDDPRYQELPQWDKDLFWHFWAGDKHFRLPIPFELGVMFKVIPERLMAYSEGQGDAFRELGKTTFEAVNVIPWPEDIALLSPWIQAISNKTFTGAPIVPRREQDLLPEDQIGPYTSTAAKAISKLPGIKSNLLTDTTLGSPRKVDHIIRGYTGSLGQYATLAIDAVLDIARVTDQPPRPEVGLENWPLFKGFMGKTLTGRTDSIDKFYERYSELGRQYKSARKKAGDFEDLGEYKQFQKIARSMSELAEIYRAIEADPVLESKEKTEQIKELNLTTNNLARLALGLEPLSLEDFYPSKKK